MIFNSLNKGAYCLLSIFFFVGCKTTVKEKENPKEISTVFENYYDERMALFPLEATANGYNQYNGILKNDLTQSYRDSLKSFYGNYLIILKEYDRSKLEKNDQTSYDILKWECEVNDEMLQFPDHYMPINQFWSLPITMGQLGSGTANQPFKTVLDYDNFLGRISGFAIWCDTAIVNMRKGILSKQVYPKVLIERVLPQLSSMLVDNPEESIFFDPIRNLPLGFSDADKERLKKAYILAITEKIIPSYRSLYDFMKLEYLPNCKEGAGISDIPMGKERYQTLIKYWTTTNLSPDEIFEIGQSEVKRIREEMEKIKTETGFKGNLKDFFNYVSSEKKFFPFKTDSEVIDFYKNINTRLEPKLKEFFINRPSTKFEIRQTEEFREASASAEYNQGAPDGSRPGIFYVPIIDPQKFNSVGMESLFLHEAIPGHHYQISLQNENQTLPKFRRFIWYGAYGEGWALYSESLGKELGLYTDPYQHFGMLSAEMHRAIRLVVDVGIHTKGWTREEAIKFSSENEPASEGDPTVEIERYMAIPGQALSYKIGQLKIMELRNRAIKEIDNKFSIAEFHNEVLKNGCIPIALLEENINTWIKNNK